ncbi:LysM peptidoglycan-binding domain-containing protein [Amycolatopsis sp. SID8362]|uniref:CIS tube protein n=1 Tax=Amycolatopsis sp. SID8362 TaxID=2690346 RepID=UPI00136D18D5|nr:LysM peptidoglycan-binding domain-containing protein [Amycolatopsis sp. SID8362]NBH06058.1 LysM peptidoglycan-binding domain-containing protein [Amycolatopsis sp. SID8362]NED42757.1 LysM peptidoglycan-binding domain-containing protein [Amycolatopsis sp. SID8362]
MAIQSSAPVMRAKLKQLVGGSETVQFQFNPETVRITQANFNSTGGVQGASFQEALTRASQLDITLDKVIFAGSDAKKMTDQLLVWLRPLDDKSSGSTVRTFMLPVLELSWGSSKGLHYKVLLSSLTLNYERFLAGGQPVQISANMTLKEYLDELPPMNPTSGGLPGRAQHTVVAEDNLPRIAQTTYGSPRNWRAIAEANGVDDPLRLSSGRRLLLPGPDELREKSAP